MNYQTLYRKYRPQAFADLVGQGHVSRTLQNAMSSGKLAHAYLFCGPRGTGKTTTARILAKALDCERVPRPGAGDDPAAYEPCNECDSCTNIGRGVSFDVVEVDAASHRGIDDIRQITEQAQQAATDPDHYRVFIIDEVHQLSRDGASAFLKTLEEPPPNVIFVLATTDPDKMIATILSRCQRFDFRPVATAELVARMAHICDAEGIAAEPAALEAIARRARGGVRDALSALEQARALCGDSIVAADVTTLFGGLDTEDLAAVIDAVVAADTAGVLRHVDALCGRGIDVRVLARELADHLRLVFLAAAAPEATELLDVGAEAAARISAQAATWGPARATRSLTVLGKALARMPQSVAPRVDLEAALVECAHPEVDTSPAGIVARLEAMERGGRVVAPVASAPAVPAPVPAPAPAPASAPASPPAPAAASAPTPAPAPAAEPAPSAAVTPPSGIAVRPAAPPPPASEPAVPTAEPAASIPAGAAAAGLGDVEARWAQVVAGIKSRGMRFGAYYLDSVPVGLDGDTITVRFAHRFNADKATQPDGQELFGAVSAEVFGVPHRVRPEDAAAPVPRAAAPATAGPARTAAPAAEPATSPNPTVAEPTAPSESDPDLPPELAAGVDLDAYDVTAPAEATGGLQERVIDLLRSELGGEVVD